MDILDRYLGYEGWTARHIISRCQELTPAKLQQPFDIGQGSLHDTLTHIIRNLEAWLALMRAEPETTRPPIAANADAYLERFDAAMASFSHFAREMAAANRLDDTYLDTYDNPPVAKTFGGTILHVLTHTSVHRWEAQHMLQRLGISDLIEGDAMSWDTQHRGS